MATEKLQSFFAGVMTGIKPDLLPEFASPQGQNAVIDRIAEQQGRVRRRKGAVARTCAPITGEPQVLGIFHYPSTDAERILIIGDDGSLNVEGVNEFLCPPPVVASPATPTQFRFITNPAVATVPTFEAQFTMATASKFSWQTSNHTTFLPESGPFCVGGIFGSQFNSGGVIGDYFPGTGHSHNLSDENTVEITPSVGVSGSYCVRTTTPGAPGGWVKWVAGTPWESEAIGISADFAFHADSIAYIVAPADFIYTLPSEWAGGDLIIQIGPGAVSGVRFWITFTDSAGAYYATGGDDVDLVADTYYNIAVNFSYESSLGAADGLVQVLVDNVVVTEAASVKLMSQLKKDSGGNNRIGGVYLSVMDRLDNVCITALS